MGSFIDSKRLLLRHLRLQCLLSTS